MLAAYLEENFMNEEKLCDLVQDCFVYDKYGKVTFNLCDFILLFDDFSVNSVKAVFKCLTDNQKEFLKNNFTKFKNLRDDLILPSSSYISLEVLNDMITGEFKNAKMRPATEEELKSVSDGIKSISKPVVDNKEEENIMEKSNIVFTDENILKLNDAYLRSDNSEMPFLQELSIIMNRIGSHSSNAEKKAIKNLINLYDVTVYKDEVLPAFGSDTISKLSNTISKLKEIYNQMRDEFLKHLGLDYLVNFEEKFKDKLRKEFNEFIKSVQEEQKTNPNYAIQHAYEICWKQEIVFVSEDVCYDNFGIFTKKGLLNTNGVLDIIYKEWLDTDSSDINEQISKIISEV